MRQYIQLCWTARVHKKKEIPLSSYVLLFVFAQEVMPRIELKPSMVPVCDPHVPFQGAGLCDTPTVL